MMEKIELIPIFSKQKNFHGKAYIIEIGNETNLYSYDILVARIIKYCNTAEVYNIDSDSTLRHVKEFLIQAGYPATNKKQIIQDYFTTV